MEKRNLEVYNFSLYSGDDLKTKVDFGNVFGKDLFELLKKDIITFFDSLGPEQLNKKTINIDSVDDKSVLKTNSTLRLITGKIKIGDDDGKEQDFTKAGKKEVVYVKKKGVYARRPFFFMIIIPKNKKVGFIVLEKEGVHSCKTIFFKALQIFVKQKMSSLLLREEKFIEDEIIENYIINGKYDKITLTRNRLPKDLCDKYLGDYEADGEYQIELNIISKKGSDFGREVKKKILNNLKNYKGYFSSNEFKSIGFDEKSDIKIVSTFEKNKKTIDLSDTMKIRPYYQIDVKLDSTGFSDFEDITNKSIELVKSFELGII